MDRTLFRKLSPLSRPHFFLLLIHHISSATTVLPRAAPPLKNKNGSSLEPKPTIGLGCNQPKSGRSPAKVGCIYRIPRLSVNPNFAGNDRKTWSRLFSCSHLTFVQGSSGNFSATLCTR